MSRETIMLNTTLAHHGLANVNFFCIVVDIPRAAPADFLPPGIHAFAVPFLEYRQELWIASNK